MAPWYLTAMLMLTHALGFQEWQYTPRIRSRIVIVRANSGSPQPGDAKSMVLVTDTVDEGIKAAAGARLALEVYHALHQSQFDFVAPSLTLLSGGLKSSRNLLDVQDELVTHFISMEDSPTAGDFLKGISSASRADVKPTLQVFLDRPYPALLSTEVQSAISFLGLTPIYQDSPKRVAERIGLAAQAILDAANVPASISWDWNLHLALLNSNTIPRSNAHDDSFFILPCADARDMALIEYIYDFSKLGGTDPLLCKTNELTFQPLPIPPSTTWSCVTHACAAAYAVLRGSGASSLDSACIAYSVGMRFAIETSLVVPSMEDVAKTTLLATGCRDTLSEAAVMRKRYIEFGYR